MFQGYFKAAPFWRQVFGAGHLTPNYFGIIRFGTELFWRQFRDWQVYVMKIDKNMDGTLMHILIVS